MASLSRREETTVEVKLGAELAPYLVYNDEGQGLAFTVDTTDELEMLRLVVLLDNLDLRVKEAKRELANYIRGFEFELPEHSS